MAGYAVADPDLHIRGGRGGGSHPDFEISGGGLQKHIFRPFGPHFALNIGGAGGGGLLARMSTITELFRRIAQAFRL